MGDIVEAARQIFFSGKKWVYGAPVGGGAKNSNAFEGNLADCSYLTYQANLHAGYNVPFFDTKSLVSNGALTKKAAEYYDLVDAKDARPGDTIYYPPGKDNGNHLMVLTSWDGVTGNALGAQSTKTGVTDKVSINKTGDYWKSPNLVLRPKASTYVPELDLTGGAGTGLSSPRVAGLVNLLRTEGVEGYRPGIYTDSGGVPTVGDGFALVINGDKGYALRSEGEIKGLFRMAGIDESKYDELPFDKLNAAVAELKAGNASASKAYFGDGKSPGSNEFSLNATQADRISAAYIVSFTLPKLLNDLGGPDAVSSLSDGEFAAVGSKVYQSPNWLVNHPNAVVALVTGDNTALSEYFAGSTLRSKAEMQALAGGVNTGNTNLGASYVPEAASAGAIGHWENQTTYTDLGIPLTEKMAWVLDTPGGTGASGSITPKTIPTKPGMTYLSRDGASAIMGNGQTINAGPGGRLVLEPDGGITANRPSAGYSAGEGVYDVISYSNKGQITHVDQIQIVSDPASPDVRSHNFVLKQGEVRDINITNPDGSISTVPATFQVGLGWVDLTGFDLVQSLGDWRNLPAVVRDANANSVSFYNALIDAFKSAPDAIGDGVDGDSLLLGIQLASATDGVITDAGLMSGYGNGKYITVVDAYTGSEIKSYLGDQLEHITNLQTFDDNSSVATSYNCVNGKPSLDIARSTKKIYNEDDQLAGTITDTPDGDGGIDRAVSLEVEGKLIEVQQHIDRSKLAVDSDHNGNAIDAGDAETTSIFINGQASVSSDAIENDIDAVYKDAQSIIAARNTGRLSQLVTAGDASDTDGYSPTIPTTGTGSGTPPANSTDWAKKISVSEMTRALTSTQALVAALKSGDNAAIVLNGFNLTASLYKDSKVINDADENLNTLTTAYNLHDAFRRGDNAAILSSSAQLAQIFAKRLASTLQDQLTDALVKNLPQETIESLADQLNTVNTAVKSLDYAVAAVNFYNAVESRNYADAVMAVVSVIPGVGPSIYAAYQLSKVAHAISEQALGHDFTSLVFGPMDAITEAVNDLFGGLFGDSPPAIYGTAIASSVKDGKHVAISLTDNSEGGGNVARNALAAMVSAVEGTLAEGSNMGLVASRMPSLYYRSQRGNAYYVLTFTNADTGATEARRFNTEGQFIGLNQQGQDEIAGRDDFFKSMGQQFLEAAVKSGAIAPQWMVRTIDAQTGAGLARAGHTTTRRAAELGELAAAVSPGSNMQTFNPIVLDLDNNGISITARNTGGGVLIDGDGDGFVEESDWINPRDGILVLDKDGDGQISGGAALGGDRTTPKTIATKPIKTGARGLLDYKSRVVAANGMVLGVAA